MKRKSPSADERRPQERGCAKQRMLDGTAFAYASNCYPRYSSWLYTRLFLSSRSLLALSAPPRIAAPLDYSPLLRSTEEYSNVGCVGGGRGLMTTFSVCCHLL